MDCPNCRAQIPESDTRCRECGAAIAVAAARAFREKQAAHAREVAATDLSKVYPQHMRVPRPAPAPPEGSVQSGGDRLPGVVRPAASAAGGVRGESGRVPGVVQSAAAASAVRPAHGGAPPPRPPAQYARARVQQKAPAPPGAGMALASLICSVAGVFLLTTCIAAPVSPIPLFLGAILGFIAVQQLPLNAEKTVRAQAQFGLWIGVGGSVLVLLFLIFFAGIFVLGMMEGAASV